MFGDKQATLCARKVGYSCTNMFIQFPEDIIFEILKYTIDRGSIYKSVIFSCKSLNIIGKTLLPKADIQFCNQLIQLLGKYPNKLWNWYGISRNPNITWEF